MRMRREEDPCDGWQSSNGQYFGLVTRRGQITLSFESEKRLARENLERIHKQTVDESCRKTH